jgi:hypothetical protein
MKKILEVAWKFINSRSFGYAVAIVLIIFLAGQCQNNGDLKRENKIKDQNISAAKDSVNSYKNKNGELVSEKAIWVLTEKQLKEENFGLYQKVRDQEGRIISLNNSVFLLKQDTAILHDTIRYLKSVIGKAVQINEITWGLPWELNYKWDKVNFDQFIGHTIVQWDSVNKQVVHKNTLLDKRISNIELTFGEKVVNGNYNVYVTSSYPGLSVKSLEGFFTDPNSNKDIKSLMEKNHWFTGLGVGPNISLGYDPFVQKPGLIIGVGLNYNIYQW